jgi:hypothetical protein
MPQCSLQYNYYLQMDYNYLTYIDYYKSRRHEVTSQ